MTATPTIGQAIDQMLNALQVLDKKQQQTAIITVCSVLEIEIPALWGHSQSSKEVATGREKAASPIAPPILNPAPAAAPSRSVDIKFLKQQKNPESARQMACVVAFYLAEHAPEEEKKTTVSVNDMEKYFKQAGYPLPTKMEQLLLDCKKSGYFDTVNRGEYKLTRVGYNLVAHSLPKSSPAK